MIPRLLLDSRHQSNSIKLELLWASRITQTLVLDLWSSSHCKFFGYPRKELLVTKNLFRYSLVMLGIALGTCLAAHGMIFTHSSHPEVDPSLAISAITLLAGSIAVMRVRRTK
jgi:hypothetical protein